MSVEAAAHTHSRHRDYGVARDLDVLIGQAGRHEPHSLKPRRAPPSIAYGQSINRVRFGLNGIIEPIIDEIRPRFSGGLESRGGSWQVIF